MAAAWLWPPNAATVCTDGPHVLPLSSLVLPGPTLCLFHPWYCRPPHTASFILGIARPHALPLSIFSGHSLCLSSSALKRYIFSLSHFLYWEVIRSGSVILPTTGPHTLSLHLRTAVPNGLPLSSTALPCHMLCLSSSALPSNTSTFIFGTTGLALCLSHPEIM